MSGAREVVFSGAAIVGAATATTSATTLYDLAQHCRIAAPYAAALPIALDVGAAIATLAWITQTGPASRWGRAIALTALCATVIGNGVEHAISAGLLAVTLPLILAVSASIPAMFWGMAHLTAVMSRPAGQDRRTQHKRHRALVSAPKVTPDATVRAPAAPVRTVADEVRSRRGTRDQRMAWLRAQDGLSTWSEQVAAIERHFNVSKSTARRIVEEVRAS